MRYIIIWLLSACAVFAQTNVKYALPLVTADSVAWTGVTSVPDSVVQGAFTDDSLGTEMAANEAARDLELQRLKGISLTQNDLLYMYNHNTKLIATCESDESWADVDWSNTASATHGDDTTNYKVGSQGISITTATTPELAISLDFTDKDLSKFEDSSESTDDDYIEFSIYIADKSNISSAYILFPCNNIGTQTDYYYYAIHSIWVDGWNHIKIQKSAFLEIDGSEDGTLDWSNIKGISFSINAIAASSTSYTIDAIRMTRKDPISANPNPFQIENDGVMERVFEVSEGTPFLGYDGSTLVVKALERSKMYSTITYDCIYVSATMITSATDGMFFGLFEDSANRSLASLYNDEIIAGHEYEDDWNPNAKTFAVSADDEVTLYAMIDGKSAYGSFTKSGTTATAYASGNDIGEQKILWDLYVDASLTSFKCSSSPLMVNQ